MNDYAIYFLARICRPLERILKHTLKRLQANDPTFPTKIRISRHRVGFDEAASDRWMTALAEQAEA